ncbi:MAG: LapA family protein [Planctomycetales bacterium]|nr:LapA family protein [Planctomycetales bacterium]
MRRLKLILWAVVLILALIIILQNLESTSVHVLFMPIELPLAALLSITLGVGFVLGLLANTFWRMRYWRSQASKVKQEQSPNH